MHRKFVLITGASKGLGFSLAAKFNLTHHVILVARNFDKNFPLEGEKIFLDLTAPFACIKLCETLIENNLIPDIIIHNLGGKLDNDNHPLDIDILQKTLKLNVEIPIEINNMLLPEMIKKKEGKIIHISSDCTLNADASPCYTIAKSSLNAYVRNIARMYVSNNIIINAFLPGPFIYKNSYWDTVKRNDDYKYNAKVKKLPLKRFLDVEEISDVIYHFCSSGSLANAGALNVINGGG